MYLHKSIQGFVFFVLFLWVLRGFFSLILVYTQKNLEQRERRLEAHTHALVCRLVNQPIININRLPFGYKVRLVFCFFLRSYSIIDEWEKRRGWCCCSPCLLSFFFFFYFFGVFWICLPLLWLCLAMVVHLMERKEPSKVPGCQCFHRVYRVVRWKKKKIHFWLCSWKCITCTINPGW